MGFPINIKEYRQYNDQEILYYESMTLDAQLSGSNGAKTANQTLAGYTPPPSWKVYIESVSASINDAANVPGFEFLIQKGASNLKPSGVLSGGYRFQLINGTASVFPFNDFLHEGETMAFSTVSDLTNCKSSFSIYGRMLCNDNALTARHKALVIGDSISANTVNIVYGEQSWWWIVRDWLWSQGVDIRMINKSRGAFTSMHTEWLRRYQKLFIPDVDVIFYALGMNDGTVSLASFQPNFTAFLAYKRLFYPKALLVVCGPSKSLNSGTETVLATIRTWEQAQVEAANDPLIQFVDFAATQTAAGKDTITDIPDNTHPSIDGHAAMGAGVIAAFQTGGWINRIPKRRS